MEKLNKVAQISLLFWLMKIIATTLGETFGDYISITLNYGYAIGLGITAVSLIIILIIQLFTNQYIPFIYWLVIVATTTLGTEISDFIDRSLHLGYTGGSILLLSCLILTLAFWLKRFKGLEVSPIVDRKKEILYWVAILLSNSLGTAFGDYLSDIVGLSYLQGAMATAGVIIVVLVLHYSTKINQILLFWLAFIFTRPFGATFGDFLTKPITHGGLELGTLLASFVSMGLLAVLIIIAHIQLSKVKLSSKKS